MGYYYFSNSRKMSSFISGTRREGSLDCIAGSPLLLKSEIERRFPYFKARGKNKIIIWKGNPSYKTVFKEFNNVR